MPSWYGILETLPVWRGTYTTSGNVVTTGQGDLQYSYCVSEDTLTIAPQSQIPKTTTGTVAFRMQ